MSKVVGASCSQGTEQGWSARYYVNTPYADSIARAGALMVLLPISEPESAGDFLDRLDGLLLPGGGDVEPHRYGQTPHPKLGSTNSRYDEFEIALVREAMRREMPILAICRGIQILNVALGGTLYQDLPSELPSAITHRQAEDRPIGTHTLEIVNGSFLHDLIGSSALVNSFHHQAVNITAPGLKAVAHAPDGVIEAVESAANPRLIAVQFHPEEMSETDPKARSLFTQFVKWL